METSAEADDAPILPAKNADQTNIATTENPHRLPLALKCRRNLFTLDSFLRKSMGA